MQQIPQDLISKWVGTSFWHGGKTPAGVDCANFVGCLLLDMGVISAFDTIQNYSRDWFIHSKQQFVLNSLLLNAKYLVDKTKKVVVYDKPLAHEEGDVLLFSMVRNGIANHVGIFLYGNRLFHCANSRGVCISPLGDFFRKRLIFTLRLE